MTPSPNHTLIDDEEHAFLEPHKPRSGGLYRLLAYRLVMTLTYTDAYAELLFRYIVSVISDE